MTNEQRFLAYIENALPVSEKAQLETDLELDAALKTEFEAYKAFVLLLTQEKRRQKAIKEAEEITFIVKKETTSGRQGKASIHFSPAWGAVAATVLLLIVSVFIFFPASHTEYASPYQLQMAGVNEDFQAMQKAFDAKEYEKVMRFKGKFSTHTMNYYLASEFIYIGAAIELKEYVKAENELNLLAQNPELDLKTPLAYSYTYLYLKQNKLTQARKYAAIFSQTADSNLKTKVNWDKLMKQL